MDYSTNLPDSLIQRNIESETMFKDFTTDELVFEVKRRKYVAKMEQYKDKPKKQRKIKLARISGIVQNAYTKNRTLDRWEYRVTGLNVETPDIEIEFTKHDIEHGVNFTLSKRFFNTDNAPKIGDTVILQFEHTLAAKNTWRTYAKIIDVVRPSVTYESDCKF